MVLLDFILCVAKHAVHYGQFAFPTCDAVFNKHAIIEFQPTPLTISSQYWAWTVRSVPFPNPTKPDMLLSIDI